MKVPAKAVDVENINTAKPVTRHTVRLVTCLVVLLLTFEVVTVNGDLWPINYEANRRHMFSFDAIILKEADHFLMINRTEEFNRALEKAINMILKKKVN